MTGPALSTFVGAVETASRRAGSLVVRLFEDRTLIGSKRVAPTFKKASEAERESGDLAEPLRRVSEQVALQEEHTRDGDAEASAEALAPSLDIGEVESRELLKALRRGGSALRSQLTDACENAFRAHRFLGNRADEPAITFEEEENAPHVLWDLMYDGGTTGDVRWESFWGFRVPIAHWVFESRTDELRLRAGFFAGVHEGLPFAAREIAAVAKRLQPGTPCQSVVDYFTRFVHEGLHAANLTADEANAWFAAHPHDWLEEFLSAGPGAPNDPGQWKHDKIIEMLRSTDTQFDLLHFACHSAPTTGLASRSELTMKVGGETLTFDVGGMMANLRIEITDVYAPGPLVFLNACRGIPSAQPFQPPPFATTWINDRGALAVISAVCPVPDYFAHAFALKYYDYLFGSSVATFAGSPVKGSLAGALLATRRYFMETHRNPLGLAYILYASPGAHLCSTVASAMGAADP